MSSNTAPALTATSIAQGVAVSSALIARQAICTATHAVHGYELFNRAPNIDSHTPATDVSLVFNALSNAGSDDLLGKALVFVNCTHNSLAGGHLELIRPDKVVLELPPVEDDDADEITLRAEQIAALRQRGFRIAFDKSVVRPAYKAWRSLADYVKLDLSLIEPRDLVPLVRELKASMSAKIVAEKIETAEQFDMVSSAGVQLFQGYWFSRPTLFEAKLLTPSQGRVLELINLVRKQASTAEIEDVLKKDAVLAFNLMRLINSSGFGLQREITSFREAVMLLGLKKLFRWAALLLTASRAAGATPSVGSMAVVRGRLMELLAIEESLPPDERDDAFVVGIFSLLDVMLGVPMQQAVDLLSLPPAVADALLHRTGPLAPYLAMTEACETGDEAAFTRANVSLRLTSQQVNWAHLQALAWANLMVDE